MIAVAGLANLHAAEVRRRDRTRKSHRKALRNLYLASRAGLTARSVTAGVALVLTRAARGSRWDDKLLD